MFQVKIMLADLMLFLYWLHAVELPVGYQVDVGWLVFNGSFSTERLFSTIMSYNSLHKQISFIYCSIEERCTL